MKKQILAKENICKDVFKKIEKYKMIQFKIALPRICLVLIILVLYTIIITLGGGWNFLTILILALGTFASLFLITKILAVFFRLLKAVKSRSYFITVDELVYKEKFISNEIVEEAVFEFRRFGRTSDIGSELFDTSDRGVCEAAEPGDTFYLIVFKKHIICVYNTKFYKLDEELQKELRT